MNVTTPQAPVFTRPLPPEPDIQRDAEMLDLYFDPTRTTREIAEHFKLSVVVVVAWFQRPDIAAIIDFVTAASERRARDIVRENLPGTINVLQRISLLRNDERTSRAASSALLTFARGRPLPRSAARSRTASASPPRDLQPNPRATNITPQSPGRDAVAPPPSPRVDPLPPSAFPPQPGLNGVLLASPPRPGSAADLVARAGTTYPPPPPAPLDASHTPDAPASLSISCSNLVLPCRTLSRIAPTLTPRKASA